MTAFQELDVVGIPKAIAARERVNDRGTIVWHVEGAPYVTVECRCLDDNPDGLNTKLLDIELSDLRSI
jgi:hypothetical protein